MNKSLRDFEVQNKS